MGYRKSIGEQRPTRENLREYIEEVHPQEWNVSEYKSYSKEVGSGLAREVAAMANKVGGEIFIGVGDDKTIVGSEVSENDIKNALSQEGGPTGTGITSDLTEVVEITKIDLDDDEEGNHAYVFEVIPNSKIAVARDKKGNYEVFIRRGDSAERARGWEVVELVSRVTRERMLVSLYRELKTLCDRLSHGQHWQHLGLGLDFPYLQSVMEDGSIYQYLSDEDVEAVLGTSKNGTDWVGGYYRALVELRARMTYQYNTKTAGWDRQIKDQLQGVRERTSTQVEYFKRYLVENGILND